MNIYLDIDGVLLTKHGEPAEGVTDFLRHVVKNHTVYWLTTHCKGDTTNLLAHLQRKLPEVAYRLIHGINPTNWDVAKTDGIDFTEPFLWFDDNCFDFEKKILIDRGVLENWIEVDLRKDGNQLQKFVHDFPLPVSGK